jgi:hypothetical protein
MRWGSEEKHHVSALHATPGGAKGMRHLREWFAEIQPLALRGCGFLFAVLFFGVLVSKSVRYGTLNLIGLDPDRVTGSVWLPYIYFLCLGL